MDEQVIGFIRRRFPSDCNWLTGNCYYFALILHDRFPWGRIMYDTTDGHFVVEIDGVRYDWTGAVDDSDGQHNYVPWREFRKHYDELQYERIERDCIM